jgi:hypothetical protein
MQESETRFTEKGAEAIGEEARTAPASSKLLAGFGSVIPKQRPEDFRSLREEFEKGIAEEVISEA